MTALDIITLLLVGGGLVRGFLRGFVTEVLALAAWIAAIAALKLFHTPLAARLEEPVGTVSGASVLAFAVIFLGVFVTGKLVSHRIGGATRKSIVGPVDRVLGGGFGALKGLIGATLLFLAASLAYDLFYGRDAERPEWMMNSRTYPLLNASGRAIVDFVETRRGREADIEDREAAVENRQ
ncbi:CvpA family protein [Allosphingosinicella flava]|uniref:CvpA family protein n=1 Tax=Allosphingosinicella flava TaxID=2771430 RepID=A0A7T2GLB8_9SPHN|nr:CvpA family protein [Sphingosinicella flava]QPQ55969.1 CvpA family protein [Sphingosinicella flava]